MPNVVEGYLLVDLEIEETKEDNSRAIFEAHFHQRVFTIAGHDGMDAA